MVFDNIFNAAKKSTDIFSVTRSEAAPPGEEFDFGDSDDRTYEEVVDRTHDITHGGLSTGTIHGASARAKVVREESPEARAVLGFLGGFIDTVQGSADKQAKNPGSPAAAAAANMDESSATVTDNSDLKKSDDLKNPPRKSDFTQPPTAPKATAETPPKVPVKTPPEASDSGS